MCDVEMSVRSMWMVSGSIYAQLGRGIYFLSSNEKCDGETHGNRTNTVTLNILQAINAIIQAIMSSSFTVI